MSILKDIVDQLLTPKVNIELNQSVAQAILVEHAKQQDEVSALLTQSRTMRVRPANEKTNSIQPQNTTNTLTDTGHTIISRI